MRIVAVRGTAIVKDVPADLLSKLTFKVRKYMSDDVSEIQAYWEENGLIHIPRAIVPGYEKLIEDAGWERVSIPFKAKLKPFQRRLVDEWLAKGQGVISASTGCGKTVMGLYIAHVLGYKTLVVVHTSELMRQWIKRVKELTGITPSIIRQDKADISKPIVIAMLQTLALGRRINREDFYDKFGLTIYDEVHNIGAEKFSIVAPMFWDKHRLGLSATPHRKDGLSKLIFAHLGGIVASYQTPMRRPKYVMVYYYSPYSRDVYLREKFWLSRWLNNITEDAGRIALIRSLIEKVLSKNPSRRIIVLSDRLEIIKKLKKALKGYDVSLLTGSVKEEPKQIILATYKCASEGLDVRGLDTLIMATPRGDIRQSLGRIMRAENNEPLVLDIIDAYSVVMNRWASFKKRYASKQGFKVIEYKGGV